MESEEEQVLKLAAEIKFQREIAHLDRVIESHVNLLERFRKTKNFISKNQVVTLKT